MGGKTSYEDVLKQEMSDLIAQLELPELYQKAIKARWLDQVLWMDKKAGQCRILHYRLRLTTIIGGVILPALVSLQFDPQGDGAAKNWRWFPYVTFALSQAVAISAAVEEFCRYGDRWRQYRETVENLKTEGWQYLQASGPYQKHKTHVEGYPMFAMRVENIIKKDVQVYVTELAKEQEKKEEGNQAADFSQLGIDAFNRAAQQQAALQAPASLPPQPTASNLPAHPHPGVPGQIAPLAPAMNHSLPAGAPAPAPNAVPAYMMATAAPPNTVPTAPPATPIPAWTPTVPGAVYASSVAAPANNGTAVAIAGTSAMQLKVIKDTVFKQSTQSPETLPDRQKVQVKGGSMYALHSHTTAENNHVKVALLGVGLGLEDKNTWYVHTADVEIEGNEPDNTP
ncbi:MAG: DUF4231 domain-containing protein, partial [Cyanothece sp. SIO1E1]|nr:DUF4231 domain-containing protein [Cyanothece sp. SIO1E1]